MRSIDDVTGEHKALTLECMFSGFFLGKENDKGRGEKTRKKSTRLEKKPEGSQATVLGSLWPLGRARFEIRSTKDGFSQV